MKTGNLSQKQRVWLLHYLPPSSCRWNATAAARLAGYAWPNKAGPRVSHSPKVKPRVDEYFLKKYGPQSVRFR